MQLQEDKAGAKLQVEKLQLLRLMHLLEVEEQLNLALEELLELSIIWITLFR